MASNGHRCPWCKALFGDPRELSTHQEIHRHIAFLNGSNISMASNRLKCAWCDAEFEDSLELDNHQQTHRDLAFLSGTNSSESVHNRTSHGDGCTSQVPAPVRSAQNNYTCSRCSKCFNWASNRARHERTCDGGGERVCHKCGKLCSTGYGLRRHLQWHDKAPAKGNRDLVPVRPANKSRVQSPLPGPSNENLPAVPPARYHCRQCAETYDNRRDLYLHRMRNHYQVGGALQRRPWEDPTAPWQRDDGTVDQDLKVVYESNVSIILEQHRPGPVKSVYNFPVGNAITANHLLDFAREIYRRQQRAFRLNLAFGMILRHRETGQYRYFIPYSNTGILERPLYVSRRNDLDRLRRHLNRLDITNELLRNRPDTKWVPVLVTNVTFYAYSTHYPLGQSLSLPEYLLNKRSLYPLVKRQQTGEPYEDNLCAFRCLALHRGYGIKSIEGPARQYYEQWIHYRQIDTTAFEGLTLDEFPEFETRFDLNLDAFSLDEEGFARSFYKSRGQRQTTMYVNVYQNHVSYIRDFALYARKYRCNSCDRHFKTSQHLHRHQVVCERKTTFIYPGGFHCARESIFDELDQYGIVVPLDDRTFPWFVCYDFEALLQKVDERPSEMLLWTQRHVPVSVSICSNVEGYQEPFCLIEAEQDQLVRCMLAAMTEIAEAVRELAEGKWGWVLQEINNKIEEEEQKRVDQDDQSVQDEERNNTNLLQKLVQKMEAYMSQVPVLGFNSAKYDLNLIKRCLAKHLNMESESGTFVVKKNNAYTCIATHSLKFLDMSQFLAPGSSYAGFLKAYRVATEKGFFPYEWFDSFNKLEATSLPTHEDFFSHLKGSNISGDEYQYCQKVWRDQRMTTFRHFLSWYNNLDVQPFVEAVKNFQKFYFDKGVDVFKSAISVPGIARQLLFRTARRENANFALFDQQNADLYQTVKRNIVGGPSIIFTRHHCVGQTRIRGKKLCGSILGFDANALYLQAIGQPMPVGAFVRRLSSNDFQPELRDKYMSAYYWMDWLMHQSRLSIQHKLNSGREVKIGKYPVDGYAHATHPGEKATVYQFHGCYWHGHLCDVTRTIRDEKWRVSRVQRFRKTQETTAFLKREYNVVEIWECEFRQYCQQHPQIYRFIDERRPGFFRRHKGKITEDGILEGVIQGDLFGMVEVDIEVPQQWLRNFRHPVCSPYEYFQEMSPLFCTTEIPFDAIGEHMQDHIREQHLSDQTRRLLVGGMKARQLLLATPLLQWYLNHGLVVTRIYQVVEFQKQRCFRQFVREVSDARRQGDVDPDTTIIADTMKVIGNSGYGSLIMDKTKHRDVKYVQGEHQTCLKVNDPLFRKLECLDEEEQYYEMEMAKRKIKLDLPIQLGYFILQYAKLRMLEFYYDFMDQYVDRSDFEYCEMDTDSAYMAISASNLEDVIKPEMREKYQQGLTGFCTGVEVEADAQLRWFPRTCCTDHIEYDRRSPGLFKLEYHGHEMIGLCSKTYIIRKTKVYKPSATRVVAFHLLRRSLKLKRKRCPNFSRERNEYKMSSKGVSKRHIKAPMSRFRRVLTSRKAESGENRGFRVRKNTIFTYTQERRGFSYLYCKRKVLEDGINTAPLDITLCPMDQQEPDHIVQEV